MAKRKAREPDLLEEFEQAQERVSFGIDRANWLLRFAQTDLARADTEEQARLRWDAFVFTVPEGPSSIEGVSWDWEDLPTFAEIKSAAIAIVVLLGELRKEGTAEIDIRSWKGVLKVGRGPIRGQPLTWLLPFKDAFQIQVYEVLTGIGRQGARLKFCARATCGKPFIARMAHKTHCTETCAQGDRTKRWRDKNREKFREYRRRDYAEKVKKTHPHARVQRQRSHVKPSPPRVK